MSDPVELPPVARPRLDHRRGVKHRVTPGDRPLDRAVGHDHRDHLRPGVERIDGGGAGHHIA